MKLYMIFFEHIKFVWFESVCFGDVLKREIKVFVDMWKSNTTKIEISLHEFVYKI